MHSLYSLLHSLSSPEWSAFEKYLTSFTSLNPGEIKQLALAQLLIKEKEEPSSRICCLKIYSRRQDPGFEMLKSRLKEKLLDFLLTDLASDRKENLDETDLVNIKLKKRAAQYQLLLYSKKRVQYVYKMLDEVIHLAKKYEYYSTLTDHLRMKRSVVSMRYYSDEHNTIGEEIDKYWCYYRMVYRAEEYYQKLMVLADYSSKADNKKVDELLKKAIPELERYYRISKSAIIKYHLKMLYLGHYYNCRNYLKGRSTCLELLNLVRNSRTLYRRQRVSIIYDQLSQCELYLRRYKQAAEWAREAQKDFSLGSDNYCVAVELEFRALILMKEYVQALKIAQKLFASAPKNELGGFRHSKYNLFLANALFMQSRHREALGLLSQHMEISSDKAGWEIGARTLKIMILIDMQKFEEASLAVSSLKQLMKRIEKTTPAHLRDKKILNLLLILERNGFCFKTLKVIISKYLDPLSHSKDKNISWQPFTHELIPFHEWFSKKMNNKRTVASVSSRKLAAISATTY